MKMIQVILVAERLCHSSMSHVRIPDAINACSSVDGYALPRATTIQQAMAVDMVNCRTIFAIQFGFPFAVFDAALSSRIGAFCDLNKKK
jgi:hypothetical protein